jgi:hypothetical protein
LEFYSGGGIELRAFRMEKVNINQALKARGLSKERRAELLEEKVEIDGIIDGLVDQQKGLQADLTEKKKIIRGQECFVKN